MLKSFDGNLKFLYMIFLAFTFIYSFWLLYISYSQSNNVNFKHQIKYILFGGITSLVLTFISSLIFPIFGVELRSLCPTAMMIFVGSTFYAVSTSLSKVKHSYRKCFFLYVAFYNSTWNFFPGL